MTTLVVACGGATESDLANDPGVVSESDVSQSSQELFVSPYLWDPDSSIPVCWEANGNDVSGQVLANVRAWTQDEVTRRWGAFSKTQFTGWGTCPTTAFLGARVVFYNARAGTNLGLNVRAVVNGVKLDSRIPEEFAIRATAVHEFGHVLGYAHEQNRPDTPADCLPCNTTADCTKDDPRSTCVEGHCHQGTEGTTGFTTVGAWDGDSVMNYCGNGNTRGIPTYTDITGHQQSYGKPARQPTLTGNVSTVDLGTNTGVAYVSQEGSAYFGVMAKGATTANWVRLPGGIPAAASIVAAKRGTTGIVDIFLVDNLGALKVVSRTAAGAYSITASTVTNFAPPGARLAVGDSQANTLDVFVVGNDGAIKQLWSDNGYATVRSITAAGFAAPGAGITAALENASRLDVFVVGTNGAVKMVQGNGTTFPNNWTLTDPNLAPSGANLAAAQVGGGDLNVFFVGNNGAVRDVYLFFGTLWMTATMSPTGLAPAGGRVGTTLASLQRIDVFVVGNNGALYDSNQTGNTGSWSAYTAVSPVGVAQPGASVATTSTSAVFSVIKTGLAQTTFSPASAVPWKGYPFY